MCYSTARGPFKSSRVSICDVTERSRISSLSPVIGEGDGPGKASCLGRGSFTHSAQKTRTRSDEAALRGLNRRPHGSERGKPQLKLRAEEYAPAEPQPQQQQQPLQPQTALLLSALPETASRLRSLCGSSAPDTRKLRSADPRPPRQRDGGEAGRRAGLRDPAGDSQRWISVRGSSELLSRINPRVRARPLECFSVVMKKLKLQEPSFSSSRTTSGSGQLSGLGESCVTQILKPRSSFRCGLRDLHPRGCCGVQLAPREKLSSAWIAAYPSSIFLLRSGVTLPSLGRLSGPNLQRRMADHVADVEDCLYSAAGSQLLFPQGIKHSPP
ncbi:hypothetical protein FQA47_001055 [Oryzias melastigma]|uniref:Uncharacterized protein n=1 Tax=Oryzias melastigma TaxID=30732 RepID=A0A834FNA5_ORYME|nr:hypothetical protein FQA47_001055 [Oryzias melastigma]